MAHAKRDHARQEVIAEIRRLHHRGKPLNITAVKRNHPHLIKRVYAVRPFWGWRRALEDAGIRYADIAVELEEYVECFLCGKQYRSLNTHVKWVHDWDKTGYDDAFPGALYLSEASRSKMLGKDSVKGRAQLFTPHWEPLWTPEYALDRMAELQRRGVALHKKSVYHVEPSLAAYVVAAFSSWDKALRRLGLNPFHIRLSLPIGFWTRKTVLRALRRLEREGQSLRAIELERNHGNLCGAMQRVFGSVERAFQAAGIPEARYRAPLRLKPSAAETAAFLKEVKQLAKMPPLREKWAFKRQIEKNHAKVISRVFKHNWRLIARMAGARRRQLGLQRRDYETQTDVIRRIQRRYEAGWPINSGGIQKGPHRESILVMRATRLFGSWDQALRAAGFNPKNIRMWQTSPFRTKASVLKAIRERGRKGQPLNYNALYRESPLSRHLLCGGKRMFKGWSQALAKAGFNPRKINRNIALYPTAQSVLRQIRKRAREGLSLTCVGSRQGREKDAALEYSGRKYFGSWPTAVRAANLDYAKFQKKKPGKYDLPEKVLMGIHRRRRNGLPLRGAAVQKGFGSEPMLLQYAVRFFGSWHNALRRAKLDPEKVPCVSVFTHALTHNGQRRKA